jgi:DNA-binding transcriptional regulator YiaG
LVAARTALGISQEAAARELEIAWRTYIRYELGEREPRGPALRFIEGWIRGAATRTDGRSGHAKKA